MWKEDIIDLKLTRFFEISARALLSLLITAILAAILGGTLYTLYDLRQVLSNDFHGAFRAILVDLLTVLALVLSLALIRIIAVRFPPAAPGKSSRICPLFSKL